MKKFGIILIAILMFLAEESKSQEIIADVVVNFEQIPQEFRVDVASIESDLENYINNQRFTDVEWAGDKIPVDISLFLSGGMNRQFSAQMLIGAKRPIYGTEGGMSVTLLLKEDNWSFEYMRGAMHNYNPNRYSEFSTVIDYYMLLIIGHDMDTYAELDGTKVFDLCRRITTMASNSAPDQFDVRAQRGEITKYNLINEITNLRFEKFRKLIFEYYVDGLDYMAEDRENALATLAYIIGDMADFKRNELSEASVFLQIFFESKGAEMASLFEQYEDKSVYDDLMYLDPANSLLYQQAMEK